MTSFDLFQFIIGTFLAIDVIVGSLLMIYLGGFKVTEIDKIIYGPNHPIHEAYKCGGMQFGIMRSGDYGLRFFFFMLAGERYKQWDIKKRNNKELWNVPMKKRRPYIVLAITGIGGFVFCGIIYFFFE